MNAAVINAAAGRNLWVGPIAVFSAIAAAAAILLHPTAWSMVRVWASSSSYHHGFLVAPAAIWMIAGMSPRPTGQSSRLPGYAIMIAALALWLAGRAANAAIIEHVAFVTLIIGAAGVVFGARALYDWAWPLLFLYFMVPFGASLTPALQAATAQTVVGLLALVGTPVSIEGVLIRTPAGAFEIAEACSGLRFLIAAVMIAAIFAYASYGTWRKRVVFLLFAVALALLANGVRAFLMVLVATATQMRWAVGPDHWLAGWAFYLLVFVILILVGRRHVDRRTPIAVAQGAPAPRSAIYALPALGLVAAASLYAGIVIDRDPGHTAPASLTLFDVPGWRILPPPQNWRAHLPQADRTAAATYQTDRHTVYVSLGLFTHDRREAEIVAYENRAWNGEEWRRIGARDAVVYLFGRSEEARLDLIAGPEHRRLAAVTAYWLDDEIYTAPSRVKLAQMKAGLLGRNPPGGVLVIAASYSGDPGEAVAAIRAFTTAVEPFDNWLARNGG